MPFPKARAAAFLSGAVVFVGLTVSGAPSLRGQTQQQFYAYPNSGSYYLSVGSLQEQEASPGAGGSPPLPSPKPRSSSPFFTKPK